MAYIVNVFLRSGDFSEDFANLHHEGQETAENVRHEWEDEFRINGDFTEVRVIRDDTFTLAGDKGDGTSFSYEIPDMTTFLFDSEAETSKVSVSSASLDEYVLNTEKRRLDIWLNDTEDVENPIPGIYISVPDFPKELRG
jgi:hypothetical protein